MEDLIERLKLDLEWAEANEWESPICLADDLKAAIAEIEEYRRFVPFLWLHGCYDKCDEPMMSFTTTTTSEGVISMNESES